MRAMGSSADPSGPMRMRREGAGDAKAAGNQRLSALTSVIGGTGLEPVTPSLSIRLRHRAELTC